MNSKEALKDLREVKGWNEVEFNRRLDIIEKDLEVLEIIKVKNVELRMLRTCISNCYQPRVVYHRYASNDTLSEDEFNKVKAWLER